MRVPPDCSTRGGPNSCSLPCARSTTRSAPPPRDDAPTAEELAAWEKQEAHQAPPQDQPQE
ncbi:hypothetical protein ABZ599_32425 [Streptomyces misionensis]|uniref:hypothetical protein n=1 Tax=Streptomyces misionensis TaxID=67331 RepID=UPI0033E5F866